MYGFLVACILFQPMSCQSCAHTCMCPFWMAALFSDTDRIATSYWHTQCVYFNLSKWCQYSIIVSENCTGFMCTYTFWNNNCTLYKVLSSHRRRRALSFKQLIVKGGKKLGGGATFHIPLTKSATLNRLLHCSLWRFSGAIFIFEALFLH